MTRCHFLMVLVGGFALAFAGGKAAVFGDQRNLSIDASSADVAVGAERQPAPIDTDAERTGQPGLVVVVGASGAERFQEPFQEAARRWQELGSDADIAAQSIGTSPREELGEKEVEDDRDQLRAAISRFNVDTDQPLWIVFIGHGTFAGETAKFNLVGPDVSAQELAAWLDDVQRPVIVINGASASGPFINRLSAPGRVVVTATHSGAEQNYARFGEFFARSIGDLDADLDHDQTVSVFEAFLHASAATQQFYETEGRLATEHALIDDNGDGRGTPPDFFRGVRAVKSASDGVEVDGDLARRYSLLIAEEVAPLNADQRRQRDRLEQQMEALRAQKTELNEDVYFRKFHDVAIRLAELYREAERSRPAEEAGLEKTEQKPAPATDRHDGETPVEENAAPSENDGE